MVEKLEGDPPQAPLLRAAFKEIKSMECVDYLSAFHINMSYIRIIRILNWQNPPTDLSILSDPDIPQTAGEIAEELQQIRYPAGVILAQGIYRKLTDPEQTYPINPGMDRHLFLAWPRYSGADRTYLPEQHISAILHPFREAEDKMRTLLQDIDAPLEVLEEDGILDSAVIETKIARHRTIKEVRLLDAAITSLRDTGGIDCVLIDECGKSGDKADTIEFLANQLHQFAQSIYCTQEPESPAFCEILEQIETARVTAHTHEARRLFTALIDRQGREVSVNEISAHEFIKEIEAHITNIPDVDAAILDETGQTSASDIRQELASLRDNETLPQAYWNWRRTPHFLMSAPDWLIALSTEGVAQEQQSGYASNPAASPSPLA